MFVQHLRRRSGVFRLSNRKSEIEISQYSRQTEFSLRLDNSQVDFPLSISLSNYGRIVLSFCGFGKFSTTSEHKFK
jgi:hypothetical protein